MIRLSEADHANWRDRVAPDLPDLDAWLAERDQRLAQLPPDDRRRKDWFWHVSGALAAAQQDWAEKRRRGLAAPSRARAAAAGRLPPVVGSREWHEAWGETAPPGTPSSADVRAGRARPHLDAAPGGPVTESVTAVALGDRRRERGSAAG